MCFLFVTCTLHVSVRGGGWSPLSPVRPQEGAVAAMNGHIRWRGDDGRGRWAPFTATTEQRPGDCRRRLLVWVSGTWFVEADDEGRPNPYQKREARACGARKRARPVTHLGVGGNGAHVSGPAGVGLQSNRLVARMHWKRRSPLYGAHPMPSHCPPDDTLSLAELLLSFEGLWDLCCLVTGFSNV